MVPPAPRSSELSPSRPLLQLNHTNCQKLQLFPRGECLMILCTPHQPLTGNPGPFTSSRQGSTSVSPNLCPVRLTEMLWGKRTLLWDDVQPVCTGTCCGSSQGLSKLKRRNCQKPLEPGKVLPLPAKQPVITSPFGLPSSSQLRLSQYFFPVRLFHASYCSHFTPQTLGSGFACPPRATPLAWAALQLMGDGGKCYPRDPTLPRLLFLR